MQIRFHAASAVAALAVACSSTSEPLPGGPPASATLSHVALSAGSVAADGTTPATVTVTVRDAGGMPIVGVPVAISYGGLATLSPLSPTTDVRGTAQFAMTSGTPTAGAITATVGSTSLANAPTLAFHGCEYGGFVNGACAPPPFVLLAPATPASWGGVRPTTFAVGDLDGNGLDDVVVADPEGHTVNVLVAYGNGQFAPRARWDAGASMNGVVVADVNGDAIMDVVTMVGAGTAAGALVVLPGTGDGTLQAARSSELLEYLELEGAADLDGDGDLDLVARVPGGIGVLLNQGDGSFGPLVKFTEGYDMPTGLAIADLNGDGIPDVVSTYSTTNAVEVRLGQGDGTFGAPAVFGTGVKPQAVAVADLDGDGSADLVTANYGDTSSRDPRTVSVLIGNGDGTFAAHTEFATGPNPVSIAAADLDGDGHADVVTADSNGRSVSVLLGDGSGALAPPIAYQVGMIPWRVAAAHLDRDALPDLVVLFYADGTVSGILSGADGLLLPAPSAVPAPYPSAIAAADVNGDGFTDLVGVSNASGQLTLALGKGDGTFLSPVAITVPGDPSGGRSVSAGDLNGDGRADVVVASTNSNEIEVLLAQADGTLALDAIYSVGNGPAAVAIGDVDGDGHADLVVANGAYNGGTVTVLLGDGSGTFTTHGEFAAGGFPRSLALGDLDADGHPDLVVAGEYPWQLHVLHGDGAGGFALGASIPAGSNSARGATSVALADLDGDGHLDAVATDPGAGAIGVFLGNGDGTFASEVAFGVGASPRSVAIGDVDGDGKPDVVTADLDSSTVTFLHGNADGTFADGRSVVGWDQPFEAVIADLNGDACRDVVVANWGSASFGIAAGTPAGVAGWAPFPLGARPSALAVADVDGDGAADLVAVSYEMASLAVALGNGDGTFKRPVSYAIQGYPTGLAIADVNRDGKDDLVVTHTLMWPTHGEVGVLLGNGDGSFGPEIAYDAGESAASPVVGDVTGDGLLDVVIAGATSAVLLAGNGDGSFAAPVALASAPPPEQLVPPFPPNATPIATPGCQAVALADVNGDGKLDVVAANSSSLATQGYRIDEVAILLGNGDGSFQPRIAYRTVLAVRVLVAELDGDGNLDVVVASNSGTASLLLGNGDGTFSVSALPLAMGGIYLAAGDLDLDGRLDLVSSSGFSGIAAHRNAGAGTFLSSTFHVGADVRDLKVADLDGDGRPDVALLTSGGVVPLLSRAP